MTPDQALGGNNGIESVCSLTNHLHELLSSKKNGEKPTLAELECVFEAYQKQRYDRAKRSHDETTFYTKMCAWDGFGLQTASTWLPAIVGWEPLLAGAVQLQKAAVKLNFVPVQEKRMGTVVFDDEVEEKPVRPSAFGMYTVSFAAAAVLGGWLLLRPTLVLPFLLRQ
jgi:hypothetical protein